MNFKPKNMSWTDVFPVLSDEHFGDYVNQASAAEKAAMDELFAVQEVFNPQEGMHVVSTSLFWKHLTMERGELPTPTRELMVNAAELGLVSRYAPWEHYVQPLLDGALKLKEERADVVFRVYLAADLGFLVADLVEAGCEVHLMRSSSIRHNPGAMWRFLALAEEGKWITVTDSDRAMDVIHDVERTEHVMMAGLGLWRIPYIFDSVKHDNDPAYYRPMNACQFGAKGGLNVEELMKAFVWHNERGTMCQDCIVAGEHTRICGVDFPNYGFDEWCLLALVYPRLAFEGVLTFIPWNVQSANQWLAIDIEYVTWANGKSEMFFFGENELAEKYMLLRNTPAAKSTIVEILNTEANTAESARDKEIEEAAAAISTPATIAVARYNENLRWLLEVHDDVNVVIYNKGKKIRDKKIINRADKILNIKNVGRESDTYLYHVETYEHGGDNEWTIFTQGDPFPHSPAFLKLISRRNEWSDVQPLSAGYLENSINPPPHFRHWEKGEWLDQLPIRTEEISTWSLDMIKYRDDFGIKGVKNYSRVHNIPLGWNLAGHFLEMCGLIETAERAWRSDIAYMNYGAIFGVKNSQLKHLPVACIPQMRKLAQGHYYHGFIFEKLWLHIFGMPFQKVPVKADCTRLALHI